MLPFVLFSMLDAEMPAPELLVEGRTTLEVPELELLLEQLLEPLLEPLSEGLHPPTRASVSNTDVRR